MSSTTIIKPVPPLFDEARLAVAGFLARYSTPTRRSYTTDLRQFFACVNDGRKLTPWRRLKIDPPPRATVTLRRR